MQAQLAAIIAEFEGAQARLHHLDAAVPSERWNTRADPMAWSVGECIAHLNLTSKAYIPLLRAALAEGSTLGPAKHGRYRMDPVGWLMSRAVGPMAGIGRLRIGKVKTKPAFVPASDLPKGEIVAEFDRLQAEQIAITREADGLQLERLRITSPFDARVSYNVYSCLAMQPRHQHRHLWQAEQVWGPPTG